MSKVSVREVTCPNCKEELEVKVYDSINELFDSELIEKLLKNEEINIKIPYVIS